MILDHDGRGECQRWRRALFPPRTHPWIIRTSDRCCATISTDVGANSNRRNEAKASLVPFVLTLTTPQPVFVVLPSKLTTIGPYRATRTDRSSQRFSALACLGPFGSQRKEQIGQPSTCRPIHPAVIGSHPRYRDIDSCHLRPPGCPSQLGCRSGETGCVPTDSPQFPLGRNQTLDRTSQFVNISYRGSLDARSGRQERRVSGAI